MLGNNSSLSDVRQDFLNACALHGLIPASAVAGLLGETPMQGPPETRYNRKDLLNQCKQNNEKVIMLIEEIENLDGNAGAIVGALTDVRILLKVIEVLANVLSSLLHIAVTRRLQCLLRRSAMFSRGSLRLWM